MVKEKQKNGCNLFHGRNVLPLRFLFFFSTAREQQCDSLIKHAVSWSAWKLSSMTLWPCANKSHFNKETLLAQGIKTKNPKHIRILPPFLPQKLKAWRFFTQNCSWSIYIYIPWWVSQRWHVEVVFVSSNPPNKGRALDLDPTEAEALHLQSKGQPLKVTSLAPSPWYSWPGRLLGLGGLGRWSFPTGFQREMIGWVGRCQKKWMKMYTSNLIKNADVSSMSC